MSSVRHKRWEWLSAFPQKKRLFLWLTGFLVASVFPVLPAWILYSQDIRPEWIVLFLIAWQVILIGTLCVRVVLPLMKELHAIVKASNDTVKIDQSAPFFSVLRDILAYIQTSEERQDRIQLLQKQSELEALQSQISPHFLYNTLDTIRGQALEEGSQVAPDMLEALSTLLRYTISQRGDMVPLRQELRSIDNYMKIQQFRFNNRFAYRMKMDEGTNDLLALKIPKLTLQPLVENAIFHGVESMLSGGFIRVEVFSTQSRLVINVIDNGVGMDESHLQALREKLTSASFTPLAPNAKRGSGLAVMNVNARIQLLYGHKYGVHIFSTKGIGSQFQVSLPLVEDSCE